MVLLIILMANHDRSPRLIKSPNGKLIPFKITVVVIGILI